MVTVCVTDEALALLLSAEEQDDIRTAVRLSLEKAGLKPWSDLEAELYACADGALLLARPRPPLLSRPSIRRRRRR